MKISDQPSMDLIFGDTGASQWAEGYSAGDALYRAAIAQGEFALADIDKAIQLKATAISIAYYQSIRSIHARNEYIPLGPAIKGFKALREEIERGDAAWLDAEGEVEDDGHAEESASELDDGTREPGQSWYIGWNYYGVMRGTKRRYVKHVKVSSKARTPEGTGVYATFNPKTLYGFAGRHANDRTKALIKATELALRELRAARARMAAARTAFRAAAGIAERWPALESSIAQSIDLGIGGIDY